MNAKLQSLAVNPEGFAFDPATGDSFQLNDTGIFITRQLQAGKESEEIMQELIDAYEIEREVARRDVDDFINRLRVYKLA